MWVIMFLKATSFFLKENTRHDEKSIFITNVCLALTSKVCLPQLHEVTMLN